MARRQWWCWRPICSPPGPAKRCAPAYAPCCPAISARAKFWRRWRRPLPTAQTQTLTPREIQVLAMLAEGHGNKTIAWKLGISEQTAKFHVASILSKLNSGTRTEAVTLGIRRGLILI
jgi:DNA-binding CsgD family transcriptional regulator